MKGGQISLPSRHTAALKPKDRLLLEYRRRTLFVGIVSLFIAAKFLQTLDSALAAPEAVSYTHLDVYKRQS